ncbi:hypothetical protein [Vibrio hangzhouensis]|nr:hypothetical protein [Vibrio hangzhouensis]
MSVRGHNVTVMTPLETKRRALVWLQTRVVHFVGGSQASANC